MSRSADGARLTQAHRVRQARIRAATLARVHALWPALDVTDLAGTEAGWLRAMQTVIDQGRHLSAAAAADYYQAYRAAEGAVLPFTSDPVAGVADRRRVRAVLHQTGPRRAVHARTAGADLAAAAHRGLSGVTGSTARLVLDGGRDTLLGNAAADPECAGYARVANPKACAFCAMLAGRGPVYGAQGGRFQAHDSCGCQAEPVIGDPADYRWPPGSAQAADQYEQAGSLADLRRLRAGH